MLRTHFVIPTVTINDARPERGLRSSARRETDSDHTHSPDEEAPGFMLIAGGGNASIVGECQRSITG
jgi:hypothetical protein